MDSDLWQKENWLSFLLSMNKVVGLELLMCMGKFRTKLILLFFVIMVEKKVQGISTFHMALAVVDMVQRR